MMRPLWETSWPSKNKHNSHYSKLATKWLDATVLWSNWMPFGLQRSCGKQYHKNNPVKKQTNK